MRPSAGVLLAVIGVLSLGAPCAAQDIRVSVPIEYSSGVAMTGSVPRPFAAGLRSAVLVRLGADANTLAGVAGGWLYDGERWTLAGGLRVGLRLPGLGVHDAGPFLVVEGLKGDGRAPLSVMLMGDLPLKPALFTRFGVSFTRDLERDHNEVALMVGVDLARWAGEIFGARGPHVVKP
jgi:hypothetical protein